MNQKELAKKYGVPESNLSRHLRGARVSIENAQKYARVLGVPWAEVLELARSGCLADRLKEGLS